MNRRECREHLFRMLFRREFHEQTELNEQIQMYFEQLEEPSEKDMTYLKDKMDKILPLITDIDGMIERVTEGWKINRIGKVDLTILRLAIYEMKYDEDVPTKVAINEAVEIAKIFGEDNSAAFINGILAKLV
ncbi:transcription antitermination factor NusB [Anaerosporobacter faecicola]|uniref:transcription antitermination factor NusB n=1 Tax=Anaerosporobacter faecicola TaxID=2718714 RepID=UPI00143A8B81|nr:transcription antitermination factor NusB [Anaerosporobacter faecicola]